MLKPDALQTAFRVYDFEKVSVRTGPDADGGTHQAEVTISRAEFISCGSICIVILLIDAKREREPHCPLTSVLLVADGFWQAAAGTGGHQKPEADANGKGTEGQGQQHDYVYDIYCVKDCPADDIAGADQKAVPGAPVIQVISEASHYMYVVLCIRDMPWPRTPINDYFQFCLVSPARHGMNDPLSYLVNHRLALQQLVEQKNFLPIPDSWCLAFLRGSESSDDMFCDSLGGTVL